MNALKTFAKPASSKPARRFSLLAVAGVAITVGLTARGVVKADQRLKQIEKENANPEEKVLETWKVYVPAAVAASLTIAFILKANQLQRFRTEALLTAFIVEPFVTGQPESA